MEEEKVKSIWNKILSFTVLCLWFIDGNSVVHSLTPIGINGPIIKKVFFFHRVKSKFHF
jgi:hypothetical protein